ncbi:hypothetical protein [Luteolibacter sp. AS25]|uniref:hypothetical protein n=1 Tax=Luteolibacter sp. AS25 TaxID=3135776 RepID=UPI00398B4315
MQPGSKRPQIWLWPNLVGLDAPIVAVCWQWFLADVFSVDLPDIYHLILALSVWCIYLADRLYDALNARDFAGGTHRLQFTKTYFRPLICIVSAAAAWNLFLIWQNASVDLIRNGLLTGGLVIIYYGSRIFGKKFLSAIFPREILCGFLFTAGTSLAVYTYGTALDPFRFIFAVTAFGILCSLNCILISIWEQNEDLAVRDLSSANRFAELPKIVPRISLVLAIFLTLCIPLGPPRFLLAVSLAAVFLTCLAFYEKLLSREAIRVLGDTVLLTPIIVAAVAKFTGG